MRILLVLALCAMAASAAAPASAGGNAAYAYRAPPSLGATPPTHCSATAIPPVSVDCPPPTVQADARQATWTTLRFGPVTGAAVTHVYLTDGSGRPVSFKVGGSSGRSWACLGGCDVPEPTIAVSIDPKDFTANELAAGTYMPPTRGTIHVWW